MKWLFVCVLGLSGCGAAAGNPAVSSRAKSDVEAEIKKTTNAFVGDWNIDAVFSTEGGGQPKNASLDGSCREIALGKGAHCRIQGQFPKVGHVVEDCLVGYDPEGTGVHMMCITSDGWVHDHRGRWQGDAHLQFEPLRTTASGKPATEAVVMKWLDDKTMETQAVISVEGEASEKHTLTWRKKP